MGAASGGRPLIKPLDSRLSLRTAVQTPGLTSGFAAHRLGNFQREALLLAATVLLLLWPALLNGFPLMFPDSGIYLGIAYGRDYGIDRSSFYGFLLKPVVTSLPGVAGLWLVASLQALIVAGALRLAQRRLMPSLGHGIALLWIGTIALLTSLPWHAAQVMPDAFSGVLVLLSWLAASRAAGEKGVRILWLWVFLLALTHYTHLILFLCAAAATIACEYALRRDWRDCLRRVGAAALVVVSVVTLQAAANSAVHGRAVYSPGGPVFLFARLNEDGLVPRWLDRHCGRDAPEELCAARERIASDSQVLLWHDRNGIVARHVWFPPTAEERWRWVEMMNRANRGAIRDEPLPFLWNSAAATWAQFTTFAALDDECPVNCVSPSAGINETLRRYRPDALLAFQGSRQPGGGLGRDLVRSATSPVAALALLLLPLALVASWRRRDGDSLSLGAAIMLALVANAAMAGALSDVHDRYQSRLVWLPTFLLVGLALRWLGERGARRASTLQV
jgi:hypothetical protein